MILSRCKMKKVVILGLEILLLLIGCHVYAQDTMYSLNKYEKEELRYLIEEKENKGFVTVGTIETKEKEKELLFLKYQKTGTLEWEYHHKVEKDFEPVEIVYSYDLENKIDGYYLLEKKEEGYFFLKINEKGKLVEEIPLPIPIECKINKLVETSTSYLFIGNKNSVAYLGKLDKNLNKVLEKEYIDVGQNSSIEDLIEIEEKGYYAIIQIDTSYKLVQLTENGEWVKVIKEDFEEKDSPRLIKTDTSYLLYGITHQVKFKKEDDTSYYLIKYNEQDEKEWETIGETPLGEEPLLQIETIQKEEKVVGYYLLTTEEDSSSIEVVRIDIDGGIGEKVKKIKNDYYKIKAFHVEGKTMYFVGQIICPEKDNCDLDKTSLFLISDEDKVIEVKDKDSKAIFLGIGILILLGGILYFYMQKKKKLDRKA